MAEHPQFTAFQRQRHRRATHVQLRRDLGMQMEPDRKGNPLQPDRIHLPVEGLLRRPVQRDQQVLAHQPAAIESQLQRAGVGQTMGAHITVMPALETHPVRHLRDLDRHIPGRIHQPFGPPRQRAPGLAQPRAGIPRQRQAGMAGRGPPGAAPLGPEGGARAAIDDHRPPPRCQLEREGRGMGIGRGRPRGWPRRIHDHAGAARAQPGKAHRQPFGHPVLDTRGRQRRIQPPLKTAPPAMEPRQPAIGMAQGPQAWGDPVDGLQQVGGHPAPGLAQRCGGPCQQGENLQQFLGVTGGNAALRVHLGAAIARQRPRRRIDQPLHPLQRQPRIDHAGQRLEPRQPRRSRAPAPPQKDRLLRQ